MMMKGMNREQMGHDAALHRFGNCRSIDAAEQKR